MTNPNDPTFPVDAHRVFVPKHLLTAELAIAMQEMVEKVPGLTKREYFACEFAKSFLQGAHWIELFDSNGGNYDWKHISEASLGMAEAFIAVLNEEAQP